MDEFIKKVQQFLYDQWWVAVAVAGALLILLIVFIAAFAVRGSRMRQARENVARSESDAAVLLKDKGEMAAGIETAGRENEELKEEIERLTARADGADSRAEALEKRAESLDAKNKRLAADAEKEAGQSARLQKQNEELKSQLTLLKDANAALLKDLENATAGMYDAEEHDANKLLQKENIKFTVKFDRPKQSWVIMKQGQERVYRRVATKEEAMKIARELSQKYDASLTVHKKDGKFQKT